MFFNYLFLFGILYNGETMTGYLMLPLDGVVSDMIVLT